MHVLTVDRETDRVVLTIESDAEVDGCPGAAWSQSATDGAEGSWPTLHVSGSRCGWCG